MYSLGEIKSHKYGEFQSLSLKDNDANDGNQIYLDGEFLNIALKIWKNRESKRNLCVVDEALAIKLNKIQDGISKESGHVFRPYKEDSTIYVKIFDKNDPEIMENNYMKLHVFSVFKDHVGLSFLQIKLADFGPYYHV